MIPNQEKGQQHLPKPISIRSKPEETVVSDDDADARGNLSQPSQLPPLPPPASPPDQTESGDAEIGKNSNIGAGTITCNYDGIKKSKTNISDNVFIGSNSSLVAPVKVDKNSVVGAGSVITKNVKKKTLALTRATQIEVKNYKRKKK